MDRMIDLEVAQRKVRKSHGGEESLAKSSPKKRCLKVSFDFGGVTPLEFFRVERHFGSSRG